MRLNSTPLEPKGLFSIRTALKVYDEKCPQVFMVIFHRKPLYFKNSVEIAVGNDNGNTIKNAAF